MCTHEFCTANDVGFVCGVLCSADAYLVRIEKGYIKGGGSRGPLTFSWENFKNLSLGGARCFSDF
jgi:hypothetical protein